MNVLIGDVHRAEVDVGLVNTSIADVAAHIDASLADVVYIAAADSVVALVKTLHDGSLARSSADLAAATDGCLKTCRSVQSIVSSPGRDDKQAMRVGEGLLLFIDTDVRMYENPAATAGRGPGVE